MPRVAPAISTHIKFFFLEIHRVSAVRFGGMRGFVGTGREPVPDVLIVAM